MKKSVIIAALNIIYVMEDGSGEKKPADSAPGEYDLKARRIIESMTSRRQDAVSRRGLTSSAAMQLAKSAGQFLAWRESTGGETVLARYPFLGDWGRDTMIALPGLAIITKRYETCKSILHTFLAYQKKGLLPNLFPEPVEINAYWYNSLRMMEHFAALLGKKEDEAAYASMAETAGESFASAFWMEEKHCLKDVVSGTEADTYIRCNQIWAVSLLFSLLPPEKEMQVVETVFEKLYTPYGLRTLAMEEKQFRPFYGGNQIERDLAYHQGTVWVFPLGAYYLAYLKVHGYQEEALKTVRRQLEMMECAMREGCIGQLPEIYDGDNPTSSKGCFAQAWSVGEILRVYEALEQHGAKESLAWKKKSQNFWKKPMEPI